MSRKKDIDLDLTGFAELFMNDEGRAESRLPRIYDIPLSEIDDFPNHPFKVKMDEDMNQLVQSVKERGIITPVTLRQKEDGRYEIVSGHRRRKACELAGLERVPAEIKELSRDQELAEQIGESREQVRRYIRLTELIPELLDMVDENKIAFRPAVELSYLTETEQHNLLNSISYNDATPSLPQAIRLKEFSKAGKLSAEVIEAILGEEKPNQKEKISFKAERLRPYIPSTVPLEKTEDYIIKALEYYQRARERQKREQAR
jgi:ParB family chromosome partitioning protein